MLLTIATIGLATSSSAMRPEQAVSSAPVGLKCESAVAPFIDLREPCLSWKLDDPRNGAAQTAYRILVASSAEKLARNEGDLWDSGKVSGAQTTFVRYAGKPLEACQRAWWKVRYWDQDGIDRPWSEPTFWETALLDAKDWHGAEWIAWKPQEIWSAEWKARKEKEMAGAKGPAEAWPFLSQSRLDIFELMRFHEKPYDPAPLFRKEFKLDQKIRSGRVYISGLGYYEMTINGKRVGDHQLDPAWTDYSDRVCYVAYDVTKDLKSGPNAIGVMLGRGFYGLLANDTWGFQRSTYLGQPKLKLRLMVELWDGTTKDIVSGPDWRVKGGPVVYDCPRRGEVHDARLAVEGWDSPGFDDSAWAKASPAPAPAGALEVQRIEPIRAVEEVRPVAVSNPKPGVYVYDLGRSISGWPRLKLFGPAGTEILLRYSSSAVDETLAVKPYPFTQSGFILSGRGVEEFEPRFFRTSFRYVVVSGVPTGAEPKSLTGIVVHTDLPDAGHFECSNPLLNDIHRAVRNTLLDRAHGIPTDSQREQMGWATEGRLSSEATIYNFDTSFFHRNWIIGLWDSQGADGYFGIYAPSPSESGVVGLPCWTASGVIVPWTYYLYYGDTGLLAKGYDSMRRYMDALQKTAKEDERGILHERYGDWLPPKEGLPLLGGRDKMVHVPPEGSDIYGMAYYYQCAKTMESIAKVLKRDKDADSYAELAKKISEVYNREFYDPEMKCYRGEERRIADYRQSPNAISLFFGLVPDDRRTQIVKGLADNLAARNYRLSTGILGTQALMEALPLGGQGEAAYKVAAQTESPSWGHMIRSGSQYIWERWDGGEPHQGFNCVGGYFYRYLAGIRPDPEQPGFKKIRLTPTFPKDLEWVNASHESLYGTIRSEWKKQPDGAVEWKVIVPPNTSATAFAPDGYGFDRDAGSNLALTSGCHILKLLRK